MSAFLLFQHPVTPGIEMQFLDEVEITPVAQEYFAPGSMEKDLRNRKADLLIGQVEDDRHLIVAGAPCEGEAFVVKFRVEPVDRDGRIS